MSPALLLLLPALTAGAAIEPVVTVGPFGLPAAAVSLRAEQLRSRGARLTPDQLLEGMIDELTLAAEARRTGVEGTPPARALVEAEQARALASLVERELARAVVPAEESIRALFHQSSDTVSLQLLVLPSREDAAQALARLAAGGEFALEAARSLDPASSRNRGETGPLSRIQMDPRLAEVAFREEPGRLFGPLELTKGWGVARVLERRIGTEADFQARRPSLLPMATAQAVRGAKEHLLGKLREKHGATVDEPFLESLGQRVEVAPAELDRPFATVDGVRLPYRELLRPLRSLAGGRAGGHMLGAPVKRRIAWDLVDERLLAAEARARGLDASAEARAALALAEVHALSVAMAERLRDEIGGADAGAALRKRVAALRKQHPAKLDRKAALAAAGARG